MTIEMVNLKSQFSKIQTEIENEILDVVRSTDYINGPQVSNFINSLSNYLDGTFVIPCANGTDALQIAMMALELETGDEVIVPSFTYVATAEVIGLLKLKPIMVDVDPDSFNITRRNIENAITPRTKAIVPVHLFGQCADMEPILELAKEKNLYVIEDAAQAIGAVYSFANGGKKKAGTMGNIGCTSFFPSKNLGCFGDGGAIFTQDDELAKKIKMLANHGQEKKYIHKYIGVNSRLDSIQAAILNVKLKYISEYNSARNNAAKQYDYFLENVNEIIKPIRVNNSSHVFHQYTIRIKNGKRDELKKYLNSVGIPAMIYYPIPLNKQEAYSNLGDFKEEFENTEMLCKSVLSLPMHTELHEDELKFITDHIIKYFNLNI